MRKKNITRWTFTPQLEALLFFAELIDELTFTYTVDSFKPSVHNVFSLIRECMETVDDIMSGTIKQGALPSIVDEIKEALERDDVFAEVIKASNLDLLVSKIDSNTKFEELKLTLEMFLSPYIISQYNDAIKAKLADLIKNHGREKQKIEKLARLFVAQMKFMGYPNASIYKKNIDYFFGNNSTIQQVSDIDAFFALFDFKEQQYTVCLFGNHLYNYLKTALPPVGIQILDNFDFAGWDNNIARVNGAMPLERQYIVMTVKAMDEYHALLEAIDKLRHFTSLFSFYHHKERFTFLREESFVKRDSDGQCYKINIPQSSMLACEDKRASTATDYYQQTITQIVLDVDSFERFTKSLRLHDSCIHSSHAENQFLNLFTAFDVLIPKDTASGKDRIVQITEILIPYLCHLHFQKIAVSFGQDLRQWKSVLYTEILGEITDGNSEEEKLCALLSLAKYQPQRERIMEEASEANFFLLRYRLWKLNSRMHSVSEVRSTFLRFDKRMRWHITRLYRTRNLIVHAGAHPVYIDMLLENIHSFYDIFMRGVLSDITTKQMHKLEYSYMIRHQRYEKYVSYLKGLSNNDSINEDNFSQILGLK